MDWLRKYCVSLFILIFQLSRLVSSDITGVRLVGGPVSNKGTVEIRQDNGTWVTTCGVNIGINDVIVICRQLGNTGASIAIENTPYGQNSTPTIGLNCMGDEADLSECGTFPSSPCHKAGAASCHGEMYLGCFADNKNDRVFPGENIVRDPGSDTPPWMTISRCIQFCNNSTTSNYAFAGVENEEECFCGEEMDDYTRHTTEEDVSCHSQCSGDPTDSCGGVNSIAVFSLYPGTVTTTVLHSATSVTPEVSSTDRANNDKVRKITRTSTASEMSTAAKEEPTPNPIRGNEAGLYGGIGGGLGGLIIIISILVVIIVITRRSRKHRKDNNSAKRILTNSSMSTNINGINNTALEETSTGIPRQQFPNVYEGMPDDAPDNLSRPYEAVGNFNYTDKNRVSVAYAMPNKNGLGNGNAYEGISHDVDGEAYASVSNFGAGEARAAPKKNDRLSVVYTMPDKNGNLTRDDPSVDFGSLYALPEKRRGEPDGHDGDTLHQLYAMPNKSSAGDQYESGMVENELYSM